MAKGAVTLKDGVVEQRNFDGYTPPYIKDAPVVVDVHIVPSTEKPSGCGEPPVPVIAPAVVNAPLTMIQRRPSHSRVHIASMHTHKPIST